MSDYWWAYLQGFGSAVGLIFLLCYLAVSRSSENLNVKTRNFLLDVQILKRKKFAQRLQEEAKKRKDNECEGK